MDFLIFRFPAQVPLHTPHGWCWSGCESRRQRLIWRFPCSQDPPRARPRHLNLPEDATALGESFFYWTHRPEFGPWLRACREEAGINLKDAAKAFELSFGKLQMMETGKRTKAPSYELLQAIARLYERTLGEVMEQAGVKMVRPSRHLLQSRLDKTFEQLVTHGELMPDRMTSETMDCYSPLQKRQWIEFALKLEAHVRSGGPALESILALPEDEEDDGSQEPEDFHTRTESELFEE